jgi:uncharacterized membrane protein
MALRTVILWIHVLCGAVWVGASASVALAAAALGGEPQEWRRFATMSAPRINRLCVAVASLIPITGIANLAYVAQARRGALPTAFVAILCVKVALYGLMAIALVAARKAGAPRDVGSAFNADLQGARKLIALYATIVILGAVALGLGLWLSGT